MATEAVILAILAALGILLPAMINYYGNRRQAAEQAADRFIDQMQEQLTALTAQQDIDRARYLSEIERLRQEIDIERQARIAAEHAAEKLRDTYERQISDLRAQLNQATISRDDRLSRIRELEGELERLRAQVAKLEKRDTGDLKR